MCQLKRYKIPARASVDCDTYCRDPNGRPLFGASFTYAPIGPPA
jgi:hypothetical protein